VIVKCPKCQSENPDTARFCSNCATPLPESGEVSYTKTLETPIHELTRGTLFAGRYEIIEELGTEEMGKVSSLPRVKSSLATSTLIHSTCSARFANSRATPPKPESTTRNSSTCGRMLTLGSRRSRTQRRGRLG